MRDEFWKKLDFDWIALTAVGFLISFGLLAIYSLSFGDDLGGKANFSRQLIFLVISFCFFLFFSFFDYRVWKSYSGFFYLVGVVLLVLVLFFGETIRGTSGWFNFGFFNFQPVELMKLFLILSLARYFSRQTTKEITLKQIIISFIYVIIPVFLAAKQPDMGSAVVMIVIWAGMLFLGGLKKKYLIILLLLGILIPLVGWNVVFEPHQKSRIISFMNPGSDPLGDGYNVIQSIVAVGSGGFYGKGLGHGSQSQLNFLPEKHTDFIFATIAEESGFVGSFVILGLLIILLFRFKKIAEKARDDFGKLVLGGIMTLIFFHILINVGMNLGIMPVAGLSLPFLSYGGSFLISMMISLGLSQSIWKRKRKNLLTLSRDF